EDFFKNHRGEFDFILSTISAQYDLEAYLGLLKPRGIMSVVGLPPEALSLRMNRIIGGGKVLTGNNIGGIAETQEMLDFCAEHGFGAVIEKVSVDEVDAAYDRVVAGDVKFRFVIDTETFPA
ncbi:TPA: zinc-binding dehydrogenase, partial [Corynebacterium striatum]